MTEMALPDCTRTRVAGSCYAIAQDHHRAIVLLLEHRLYASSMSLLRVAFEAYVRGQWLSLCASEAEIKQYIRGWEPPKIDKLLNDVENTPAFIEKVLSRVKSQTWKSMCAFTHTGGLHIQRWNSVAGIEPNYSTEEILEVLAFAEFVGTMSALGVAALADDAALARHILAKVNDRIEQGQPG